MFRTLFIQWSSYSNGNATLNSSQKTIVNNFVDQLSVKYLVIKATRWTSLKSTYEQKKTIATSSLEVLINAQSFLQNLLAVSNGTNIFQTSSTEILFVDLVQQFSNLLPELGNLHLIFFFLGIPEQFVAQHSWALNY